MWPSTNKNRVVRVDGAGTVTPIAGTAGFSGDGGPATQATLDGPAGVYASADGHVFIADLENSRVRIVRPDGIIDTLAGTGVAGSAGDGGPARDAQLTEPSTVAGDYDGNLYIADGEASRVRRIDRNGIITTFAGTGKPGIPKLDQPANETKLYTPVGVWVDRDGLVYIADYQNDQVYVVVDGIIRWVAGAE